MNIASYALLLHMIAQCVNMTPHRLVWSGGDTHIYANQVDAFRLQLSRSPLKLPTLNIKDKTKTDIFSFTHDDFELLNYQHHDKIVYAVSV